MRLDDIVTNDPKRILVVEPLSRGAEHATLNAGLLSTIRLAYPEVPIIFHAQAEHVHAVKYILADRNVAITEATSIDLPEKPSAGIKSVPLDFALCHQTMEYAKKIDASHVVFTSINAPQLLLLKMLLLLSWREISVMVIPHSILQTIQNRHPMKPWNYLLWFRTALQAPHPKELKIVVPGKSIMVGMLKEIPKLAGHVHALDLAYFFPEVQSDQMGFSTESIELGFLGVGTRRKGIDIFIQLAQEIQVQNRVEKYRFVVIGPILESAFREQALIADISLPSPADFIPPDEIAKLIENIDYAVLPYRSSEYQLVASAAFVDALAHCKPIIALRNPYFEWYFERMGDIGYLCDTVEELIDIILSLDKDTSQERYHEQCENVLQGRHIFTPEYLNTELRKILSSDEVRE